MRYFVLSVLPIAALAVSCGKNQGNKVDPQENKAPPVITATLKSNDNRKPGFITVQRELISECSEKGDDNFSACIADLWDNRKTWLIDLSDGNFQSPQDNLHIFNIYYDGANPGVILDSFFSWDVTHIPSEVLGLKPYTPFASTYRSNGGSSSPMFIPISPVQSERAKYLVEFRLESVSNKDYVIKCEAKNLPKNMSIFVPSNAQPGCMLMIFFP